jgi:hypothetical protein
MSAFVARKPHPPEPSHPPPHHVAAPKTTELHPSNLVSSAITPQCDLSAWIDVLTKKEVADIPFGSLYTLHLDDRPGGHRDPGAPRFSWDDHAINPATKESYVRLPSGIWIDPATGGCVSTYPLDSIYTTPVTGIPKVNVFQGWNPNHVPDHAYNPDTGRTYVHVPLPSSGKPSSPGDVELEQPNDPLYSLPFVPILHGNDDLSPLDLPRLDNGLLAPAGYCWGWVDSVTGEPAVTTHLKNHFDPFNLDPDTITYEGHTYLNDTGFDDNDDVWLDASTGDEVDSAFPDDADDDDDEEDIYVDGYHFIRVLVPCGDQSSTVQRIEQPPSAAYNPTLFQPPANAGATPTPNIYNSVFKKSDLLIGISAGVFGRTDTYDDNYKAGGTTFAPGVNFTLPHSFVVRNKFGGFDIVTELPLEEAKLDTTVTKLEAVVIGDVIAGVRAKIQNRPVDIWGGFGGGVGVVRSGYDSPHYSYSDTEPLPGITFSGGASTPLSPRFSGFVEVRYIDLFSATFGSPGGHYNMKDASISGRIGVQFNVHK